MADTASLHESAEVLSRETREMHRAIASLIEELEAVDWYQQRVDATEDEELRAIIAHNRDEEKEHACMTLEWIRRHDPGFDEMLRRFLFGNGLVVGKEHHAGHGDVDESRRVARAGNGGNGGDGSLGIGSLAREESS